MIDCCLINHLVIKSAKTFIHTSDLVNLLKAQGQKMAATSVNVPDFKSYCFICVKQIRDMSTVSTKSKSDAIHGRASELQDAYVLAYITNENYEQISLAASKYQYHRVSMDVFMKMESSDIKYTSTSFDQAFLQTVSVINDNLLRNVIVFSLSKLTAQYRQLLQHLNVPSAITYRTHITKKL